MHGLSIHDDAYAIHQGLRKMHHHSRYSTIITPHHHPCLLPVHPHHPYQRCRHCLSTRASPTHPLSSSQSHYLLFLLRRSHQHIRRLRSGTRQDRSHRYPHAIHPQSIPSRITRQSCTPLLPAQRTQHRPFQEGCPSVGASGYSCHGARTGVLSTAGSSMSGGV